MAISSAFQFTLIYRIVYRCSASRRRGSVWHPSRLILCNRFKFCYPCGSYAADGQKIKQIWKIVSISKCELLQNRQGGVEDTSSPKLAC